MATVKKDIEEESDKINKVKKLVRKRVASLKYKDIPETPLSEGTSWKDISFLYPERTVRLGTLFSGIGAIEHAFQRLGLHIPEHTRSAFRVCSQQSGGLK